MYSHIEQTFWYKTQIYLCRYKCYKKPKDKISFTIIKSYYTLMS